MSAVKTAWRVIRWPLLILAVLLIVWILSALARYLDQSSETVTAIQTQKITAADVDGANLPPEPDPTIVDATIEGVDANKNGIRDDVELAIFKKYPDDRALRAAALQYAKAEQLFLTNVFNTPTWKASAETLGRAVTCIVELELGYKSATDLTSQIRHLVVNTDDRSEVYESAFKFTTSHGDAAGIACDIQI